MYNYIVIVVARYWNSRPDTGQHRSSAKILGTSRSNDADGNENVKKVIGFISKMTTLHVHQAFLYISSPVFARLRRENA